MEADGKTWNLTLRDSLTLHDGEKVLARDCVASIKRWGVRDSVGQTLMIYTDEITASDDKTIRFRLKKPFALLPYALGKAGSSMCAMMPERLANTDPFKPITEMVGSGPYKWNAKERIVGALAVYDRFDGYKPREDGTPEWTSGPKVENFDRVEWHIINDPATAAAAMQSKEIDWWENPPNDLLPLLSAQTNRVTDSTGLMGCMRLNQLNPPFDNPAIRRAMLKGIDQSAYMIAVAGDDPKMWHVPAGFLAPGMPMASDTGLNVFTTSPDYNAVRQEIAAAGYKNEKIVLLGPSDFPLLKTEADIAYDQLKKMGFNVEYRALDWGSVIQQQSKMVPVDQGGWSVVNTFWSGLDQSNPVGHAFLRGTGKQALMGWPTAPKLEELRTAWIDAPDEESQKEIAVEIQRQALLDVPYIPLGQCFRNTSYQKNITGVLNGFAIFWNVRRI